MRCFELVRTDPAEMTMASRQVVEPSKDQEARDSMYQIGIALGGGDGNRGEASDVDGGVRDLLKPGIEEFWDDLRPGIERLFDKFGWFWLARVDVVAGDESFNVVKSKLLGLLREFVRDDKLDGFEKFVFFTSDWPEDDVVRYGSGSIDDLSGYLSLFSDWDECTYVLGLDRFQQGEGTPLLVKLIESPGG